MDLDRMYQGDAFELCSQLEPSSIDLVVCDGPYGVTNYAWDNIRDIQSFNLRLIEMFERVMKPGAALYLFGKSDCIDFIDYRSFFKLANRIVWFQPSRLAQGRKKFTNNHDIICYFTKGNAKTFNLDDIRVPQLVELEHRRRCEAVPSVTGGKFGKTRFNPAGKNPGDVWGDIKQLTYKSKELVSREALNTIQKPQRLIERLVLASSNPGDVVLDPFAGVGTTMVVCKELDRRFVGFEQNPAFVAMSRERVGLVDLRSQATEPEFKAN